MRVVAELAQDPGRQDYAEPGSAGVDLSVRVPAKMCAHHHGQFQAEPDANARQMPLEADVSQVGRGVVDRSRRTTGLTSQA